MTARITQAEPADAAGLLSGVLAEGGVLDAVRELLDAAIGFIDERAEATGRHDTRSVTLWHILSASADLLDSQAADVHRAPQLLHDLATSGASAEVRQTTVPEPRVPEDWVPPVAIREAPAALDAISSRLEAGTTPVSASMLMAPVLDADGGVLCRLSNLLASASRYAQQRGAAAELWQDLGRAGQDVGGWGQLLAGAAADLAQLPAAAQPSAHTRKSPALPAPATGADRRRR